MTETTLKVSPYMGLILLVGLIMKDRIILLDLPRLRTRGGGPSFVGSIRGGGRTPWEVGG